MTLNIDALANLKRVVNDLNLENGSNTPDFILAEYLYDCLMAFERATTQRDMWWNHEPWKDKKIFSE